MNISDVIDCPKQTLVCYNGKCELENRKEICKCFKGFTGKQCREVGSLINLLCIVMHTYL